MLIPIKLPSIASIDLASLSVAALQIILTSTAFFNERDNQTPVRIIITFIITFIIIPGIIVFKICYRQSK